MKGESGMKELRQAAETLTSLCTDYLLHGITDETFVSNLEVFSEECAKALKGKGERSHDLDTTLGPPEALNRPQSDVYAVPQTDPPLPPDPTTLGDVTTALDQLRVALRRLEAVPDSLVKRLAAILSAPLQEEEPSEEPSERDSICELADAIYDLVETAREVEASLTDIVERVEL